MANTKITSRVIADNAVLTANITDANVTTAKVADNAVTGDKVADDVALAGNPTTTTQSAGNNTTRIATTAFVSTAVSNLVDSSPSALNTLNELAAALGDDANFSTTVTNSIAAKLPLAGGAMTGNIVMGDDTSIGIADDAERIEFDGAGDISLLGANVGIGTTSPASLLHVDEGSADDCRIIAETHAGGDSMILFSQGASGSGTPTWGLGLDAGSGTSDGFSIGFEDTGYDDFSLTSDSKLVITTAGNVGIGTTSPTTFSGYVSVHHKNTAGDAIHLIESDGGIIGQTFVNDASGVVTTGARSNHPWRVTTNDTERLRVDTSGNVGIGGTPQTTVGILDIIGQSNNYNTAPMVTFKTTTTNAANRNWSIGAIDINYGDFHIGCGDSNSDFFDATAHSKFTIDKDGNVGIGTTAPATKLQLLHAGECKITLGYSTTQYAQLGRDSSGNYELATYENGAILKFGTSESNNATTERMRILANGQVLVGIQTINGNTARMHVDANTANKFCTTISHNGNTTNRFGLQIACGTDDNSGTNTMVSFLDGNFDGVGSITASGGTVTYGAFTAHHEVNVPNSDNPSDESDAYPYGTLVEIVSTYLTDSNKRQSIRYTVQKSQSANSKKVLGAYASNMRPSPMCPTTGTYANNLHNISILGDGHILCNNSGGNIEVGDGICTSAVEGIGMKATTNPSMIIGIAQEDVTFSGSETKLVAVQFGVQQFTPWS